MIFSESAQSGSCCVNCYHYYPFITLCVAQYFLIFTLQLYIFTRDGFYPDYADEQATQDPMELLYHISLTEHPAYAAAVCTDGIPFR